MWQEGRSRLCSNSLKSNTGNVQSTLRWLTSKKQDFKMSRILSPYIKLHRRPRLQKALHHHVFSSFLFFFLVKSVMVDEIFHRYQKPYWEMRACAHTQNYRYHSWLVQKRNGIGLIWIRDGNCTHLHPYGNR